MTRLKSHHIRSLGRYVRSLERRVKELEEQLVVSLTPQTSQDNLVYSWSDDTHIPLGDEFLHSDGNGNHMSLRHGKNTVSEFAALPSPKHLITGPRSEDLAEELRLLSLEAAAERYLGPSSGLSLAKLTQTVLQRLSPDQDGFMFDEEINGNQHQPHHEPDADHTSFSPIFFEMNPSVTSPLPINNIFGTPAVEDYEDSIGLALLEVPHINYILSFYFAHSHTLYPIIRKSEFESVLWRVYADPSNPLAQSSLWQFRIWMVLAIGSTTYCSVSLMDETEPVRFFNKAMTYFEAAMECGDLILVVSSQYLLKAGWLGALGRPFAIQDGDITVEPFSDAEDVNIKPEGIVSSSTMEPSTMAVPLHILALRRIASDIGSQVHSPKYSQNMTAEQREETIKAIHKRLLDWRRSMPFPLPDLQSKVPHLCTSWFDLNYYTHIITLYRPSPLSPNMEPFRMKILAEASAMAIRQAANLHRQRRFAYNWLNLVVIFNSSLSLMYTSIAQKEDLSLVLDQPRAATDLELAVEILEAFGNKFPSAKKIQGMIRKVSTKLETYATSSDIEF
ncbi:hypothetical protein N7495_001387 [Penicillium taxi]|uniref:uncharacterized protein n=1 Tax=Penicillium taxi TaxID=168475 RepID=UPI002544EB99|nr:uncharacterized protein N7495_001387 [Penicillium taxi]KAJ5908705.1 hypothetical protein N7495_001387 [Penicillium taxi]